MILGGKLDPETDPAECWNGGLLDGVEQKEERQALVSSHLESSEIQTAVEQRSSAESR